MNSIPLTLLHKKFQEKDMQCQASSFTIEFLKSYMGIIFSNSNSNRFFSEISAKINMDMNYPDINRILFLYPENFYMCTKV